MGAKSISLGERSYPTNQVMEQKGTMPLMKNLNVKVIDFDALPDKDWVLTNSKGNHWENGFRVARPILESECLVSTCCLKTHQYGGVFTMSLKLHVGCVPTSRHGYHYMSELHSSRNQRKMIAEINEPFKPALILLDGVEAFVDGGPMTGKRMNAGIILASTDRVATDATGLAVLKSLGSNAAIMQRKIFEQEQIARAVELGLGASSPSEIEVMIGDENSRRIREQNHGYSERGVGISAYIQHCHGMIGQALSFHTPRTGARSFHLSYIGYTGSMRLSECVRSGILNSWRH